MAKNSGFVAWINLGDIMRRVMVTMALIIAVALTGCSSFDKVADDLKWLTKEPESDFFPKDMFDGGEEVLGNGQGEQRDDVFTYLENKIWRCDK